jgi:hypothetical protein
MILIIRFHRPVIVGRAWSLLLQRPFPTDHLLGQLGREVSAG